MFYLWHENQHRDIFNIWLPLTSEFRCSHTSPIHVTTSSTCKLEKFFNKNQTDRRNIPIRIYLT